MRTAGIKLKSILKHTYSIIFFLLSASAKAAVPLFAAAPFVETRTGMHPLRRIPVIERIAKISCSSNSKFKSIDDHPLGFFSCKDIG